MFGNKDLKNPNLNVSGRSKYEEIFKNIKTCYSGLFSLFFFENLVFRI
jgi:hypothetical protein